MREIRIGSRCHEYFTQSIVSIICGESQQRKLVVSFVNPREIHVRAAPKRVAQRRFIVFAYSIASV